MKHPAYSMPVVLLVEGSHHIVTSGKQGVVERTNLSLDKGESLFLTLVDYTFGRSKFSFSDVTASEDIPKQTIWLMGAGPGIHYTLTRPVNYCL